MTNRSFEATFNSSKIAGTRLGTIGVCTLVVPKRRKSAFLLRIFKILGAEGETHFGYSYRPTFMTLYIIRTALISRRQVS